MIFPLDLPASFRIDPGMEFTAEVVGHPCRRLNMSLDYGPSVQTRTQVTAERLGVATA